MSFCTLVGLIEVDVTLAERMAGTTRLELATSAVTVIHSLDSTESIGYVGNSRQPLGLLGMVGRVLCNGLCNASSVFLNPRRKVQLRSHLCRETGDVHCF